MIKTMKKIAGWTVFWATFPYWGIRVEYYAVIEYMKNYGITVHDLTKEELRAAVNSGEFFEIAESKSGAARFFDWIEKWAF